MNEGNASMIGLWLGCYVYNARPARIVAPGSGQYGSDLQRGGL